MAQDLFTLVGTISINSTVANETINATMKQVDNLKESLEGTEKQANKTGKSLGSGSTLVIGTNFYSRMATKAASVGTKVIKSLGKTGFEFNAQLENMAKAFSVYTGSEEVAADLVNQLYELAKVTPLSLSSINLGARQLLAAGTSPKETIEILKMWGDVTLGDNAKFESNVRAHSKILADERVMAKELNSMTDTGVPIRSYLANYLGITTGDLAGWVKKGLIPSSVITEVLRDITSEGGIFHNKMDTMMGTYSGQKEKMGDIYSQTAGSLTKPFFELAVSDIMPRASDSLSKFNDWANENQETIGEFATALGDVAVAAMDLGLEGTKSLLGSGDKVKDALSLLPAGASLLLGHKHPILGALAYSAYAYNHNTDLEKKYGESDFDEFIQLMSQGHAEPYSMEDKRLLQDWIDARKAYDLFATDDANTYKNIFGARQWKSDDAYKRGMELLSEMNQAEGQADYLMRMRYGMWLDYKDKAAGEDLGYLDVLTKVSDDSEGSMQSQLDSMNLTAGVSLMGDPSDIYAKLSRLSGHTVRVGMVGGALAGIDGSHAKGLDFVPRDGYLARLHYGEAVLNRTTADMLRGGVGMGNTSRLESLLQEVAMGIRQLVGNTSMGQTITLDSGVLVGQLTPQIDKRLGMISNRRGRG